MKTAEWTNEYAQLPAHSLNELRAHGLYLVAMFRKGEETPGSWQILNGVQIAQNALSADCRFYFLCLQHQQQ